MSDFSSSSDAISMSSHDSESRSPVEFKQTLLSMLNNEAKVLQILLCTIPLSDIILFEHEDIEYDLRLDFDALHHPEVMKLDGETGYRQLKYTPGEEVLGQGASKSTSPVLESFRSTLPKHPTAKMDEGDFFLPIGWFVENNKKGYLHDTRYVCMLNVSTQPISMWAVYNYQAYNDEDDAFTNLENLTQIYDEDVLDWNLTQKPVTGARAVMDGKDLVLLYEDVKDWHPDSATVWDRPGKETYLLGKSVRAHTDVLPPKELLDAITVKDDKQEPKTEIYKDSAVYTHSIEEDDVNGSAIKWHAVYGDAGYTIKEFAVNNEDTVNGDTVNGDTVNGDTVNGDAVNGDIVNEDARHTLNEHIVNNGDAGNEHHTGSEPTAQKSTISKVAKLPFLNMLSRKVLPKKVLPTKALLKSIAAHTRLATKVPPAHNQETNSR